MPVFNYVARKKFKANGKEYKPGDVWEPAGSKHDAALIRHYVILQEVEEQQTVKEPEPEPEQVEEPKPAPKPRRASTRRKKASVTSSK